MMIDAWISQLRSNPIFSDISYQMVCILRTDNDGAWSKDNAEWGDMIDRHSINIITYLLIDMQMRMVLRRERVV